MNTEVINENLKQHQASADWDKKMLLQDLHRWAERFVFEFKLEINTPAIKVDYLSHSTYGHYRSGRNGFGLRDEIAIDQCRVENDEYWEVLGTLLHEMLHAEQELVGRPGKRNYHNKAFQKRALEFGLIVDSRGYTQYTPAPSPFFNVLQKYGAQSPSEIPESTIEIPTPSKSKLKLWMCECQPRPVRVRVAIRDFQAKCLKCGAEFKLSE